MADPRTSAAQIHRTYYVIAGLYTLAASLIWGVNTLFLLDAGLDLFGVFVANAAFTAGMVIFEIPTGVLADTRGRRFSFLISLAVLAAGTAAYVLAAAEGWGLGAFVVISVGLGLGFTFYSGAVEAWLVDALAAVDFEGSLDRVFARAGLVTGTAMVVGTLGGGFLADVDLAWPFVLRVALLVAVMVYAAIRLHDIGFVPRAFELRRLPAEMRLVARDSIDHGWHQPTLRLFMLQSFIHMGVINWAWYAWQPYLLELANTDAIWLTGVVAALMSTSIMVGNGLVDRLAKRCGHRTTLLIWAGTMMAIGVVLVGLARGPITAVVAFMAVGASMGVVGPVRQAYMHALIPSSSRASVISFDSMIGNSGGVGGQIGLGRLSQSVSIASGYVAGGLSLALAVPLLVAIRRRRDAEDRIVGDAGVPSACAAQGLPGVLGVDVDVLTPVGADTQ